MDPGIPTSSKRGRVAKIWNYFSEHGDAKAKCDICCSEISCKSGQTTSMRRHLEVKHTAKFSELKDSEASSKKVCSTRTHSQLKIGECAKLSVSKEKKVSYN
jgi:hypothetical protein